ncbi:MAG: GH25 family lysozyme [Oricola sp.]
MYVRTWLAAATVLAAQALSADSAWATEMFRPWADPKRAIILDGYEHNVLDLREIATDKRVTAFIHKGSDGLPPPYRCEGEEAERQACRVTWQRYAISRELYQTRRALAKNLGLKWGAYHLARSGDPLEQARHFLDFADPQPDELIALDLEGLDDEKWMSLEDAQRFAIFIRNETGRFPVLYANEIVARRIAEKRGEYRVLSRLPLWYARYKPAIRDAFPKGNWESYHIWQFAYHGNCSEKRCPYRVRGTDTDIDVNIVDMTPDQLRKVWPFGGLLEDKAPLMIPIPVARPDVPGVDGAPAPAEPEQLLAYLAGTVTEWWGATSARYRQLASLGMGGIDPVTTAFIGAAARPAPPEYRH